MPNLVAASQTIVEEIQEFLGRWARPHGGVCLSHRNTPLPDRCYGSKIWSFLCQAVGA